MKNINIGKLSIPITQYASQGNAVLGIRDSGKSYSATYLAEQLYAASIPFVTFDPSGVWKFLRVPGSGRGLPIVVAGGKAPDLPLTPQSAPEIVRAAMRANVSLVLDLYDIHMSKADWSRIVEACVRVLLYENGEHGLRHIFIEEAAEFAPQIVANDKAKVYAEVEKLARIGGNALLGYTLINQRAEQVNKAVLELCDCLFLHRQKGKNSIKSLEKWLELSTGGDVKAIIAGLPKLPSGECWVWPANADHAVHVRMPQKNTFHPDRRALTANPAAANVQRVDATKFVTELRGSLEKHIEEAKTNDPAELRKRIKELEKQVAAGGTKTDGDIVQARQTGERDGYNRGFNEGAQHGYKCGWDQHVDAVSNAIAGLPRNPPTLDDVGTRPDIPVRRVIEARRPEEAPAQRRTGTAQSPPPARQTDGRASTDIAPVQQRVLDGLAELEAMGSSRPEREIVAFMAGYAHLRSKGFINALGALKSAGLIDYPASGVLALTAEGRDRAKVPTTFKTPEQLQAKICSMLGGPSERILRPLIDAYPDAIARDDLARMASYEHVRSKGFVNALGRLRSLGFIDYPRTGAVVGKPVLFLES